MKTISKSFLILNISYVNKYYLVVYYTNNQFNSNYLLNNIFFLIIVFYSTNRFRYIIGASNIFYFVLIIKNHQKIMFHCHIIKKLTLLELIFNVLPPLTWKVCLLKSWVGGNNFVCLTSGMSTNIGIIWFLSNFWFMKNAI